MPTFAPPTLWLALTDEERDVLAAAPRTRTSIAEACGGMDPAYITRWRRKRGISPPDLPADVSTPRRMPRDGTNGPVQYTLWSRMTTVQRISYIQRSEAKQQTRAALCAELQCGLSTLLAFRRKHNMERTEEAPANRGRAEWHRYPPEEKLRTFLEAKAKATSVNGICVALDLNKDTVKLFAERNSIALDFARPVRLKPVVIKDPLRGNVPGLAPVPLPVQPPPSTKRMPSDTPTRVHLLDARFGQCRFPLWPDHGAVPVSAMFYCGAPVANPTTSYCPHCRGVISRPQEPRVRKPFNASGTRRASSLRT